MAIPNILLMRCANCQVASTCSKQGASPLTTGGRIFLCRLIGGYGKVPVDLDKMSEQTKEIAKRDGPCLTLAEVPVLDEASKFVTYELTKIFSPPVLHARETLSGIDLIAMKLRCSTDDYGEK